jgi:MFS family permease
LPSWLALFTRHVDKDHEGMEWGVYSMLTDLGGAAVAGLGGIIAYSYGFKPLFVIVFVMSIIGTLLLLSLKENLKIKSTTTA